MAFRLPLSPGLPPLAPALIVRAAAAVLVASLVIPAVPDVDLWGHTMFGGEIISAGALPTHDSHSFTSDIPWVNHEWLSEVLMHGAYTLGGGAGLVGLRLVLLVLFFGIVWRTLRRDGVSAEAACAILTFFALLTFPRTQHVRPQLFSLVAFAALLAVLTDYDRKPRPLRLTPIPVLMLLWANFHGGFIVALLPLGLWAGALAIAPGLSVRVRLLAAGIIGTGVLATLLNPYGSHLWTFLTRTVGLGRADIVEWGPIASAGPGFLFVWAVTAALAVAGVAWHERPRPLQRLALVAILAAASFRVGRLDAFFAIATVICFGKPLSTYWARRATGSALRVAPATAAVALVLSVCAAGVILVRAAPAKNRCVDDATWLPEQEATAFVARNQLQGRMVIFFNWGEYVLWQFAPTLRVSTDGRRETVYSDRHINGHFELYQGSDAGLAYLRELDPDYVWLPISSPAVEKLRTEGWIQIYAGDRSAILARKARPSGAPDWTMPRSSCFPGELGKPSPLETGLWKHI
jgi:hypothetical protein